MKKVVLVALDGTREETELEEAEAPPVIKAMGETFDILSAPEDYELIYVQRRKAS